MSSSGTSDDLVAIWGAVLLPVVVPGVVICFAVCCEIGLQGMLYIVHGLEV